jgi:hypothetical protein
VCLLFSPTASLKPLRSCRHLHCARRVLSCLRSVPQMCHSLSLLQICPCLLEPLSIGYLSQPYPLAQGFLFAEKFCVFEGFNHSFWCSVLLALIPWWQESLFFSWKLIQPIWWIYDPEVCLSIITIGTSSLMCDCISFMVSLQGM